MPKLLLMVKIQGCFAINSIKCSLGVDSVYAMILLLPFSWRTTGKKVKIYQSSVITCLPKCTMALHATNVTGFLPVRQESGVMRTGTWDSILTRVNTAVAALCPAPTTKVT